MEADPGYILQLTNSLSVIGSVTSFNYILFTFLLGMANDEKSLPKAFKKFFGIFKEESFPLNVEKSESATNIAKQDDLQEKHILKGLERFGDVVVSQIMKARIDVTYVDSNAGFDDLVNLFRESGYSRIPVAEGSFDKIIGIMNVKDMLCFFDNENKEEWNKKMRTDVLYVPESKYINHMLQEFQKQKKHIAIVVDEYGVCTGLITMEDILEEIFGEIDDESDTDEEIVYRQLDESNYLFLGKTMIVDVCKIMGLDAALFDGVRGSAETIAGLMLENLERLPQRGEALELSNIRLTVQAADKRRILKIKVTKLN